MEKNIFRLLSHLDFKDAASRLAGWSAVMVTILFFVLPAFGQKEVVDRIVAVVGDEVILESDLSVRLQAAVLQNQVDQNDPNLKRNVLEAMINEKLILAQAVLDSIIISDDEVNQLLDSRIKQLIQQYGSEQRLEQAAGMSLAKLKRDVKEEWRKQLMASRLQEKKFADVYVSRRDAEEFFSVYRDSLPVVPEEFELSHIFIVPKASAEAKQIAHNKAKALYDSLKAGADFAELAKRYSEDIATGKNGGDLGLVRRGEFIKEFAEVAFSLPERQISSPVETAFGYHLMQVLERRGEAIHVRHILIKVGKTQADDDSTIAFLKRLKQQTLAETLVSTNAVTDKFAEFAKKYSQDDETKAMGGDLGSLDASNLAPDFLASVKELTRGEISDPVKVTSATSYGYHIVYLRNRIPTHKMSLQDDWKRIEQYALLYKRNKEYAKWIGEIKKNVHWEMRL